jgi:23S rRNA (guanosine2251-2'-O)-methyltransferase
MSNVIYGHHPVVEAIKAGKALEKVFLQAGLRGEVEKELRQLTKEHDIPMQVVPKEKLERLTKGVHQGVVAWLALIEFADLEKVVDQVLAAGETPLLLLLDSITDVRNFGAICRSAEVMGVHAVVVPQSGSAPANEDAMKASAGALARIRLCRTRSMFSTVDWLKEAGIQVVATAVGDRAVPLPELQLTEPTAILVGSEGDGLPAKLLKMSDVVTKIPQASNFDSLNVSVATGVMLYEVLRQRLAAAAQ